MPVRSLQRKKSPNLSPWHSGPNPELARGLAGGSRTQAGREGQVEGGADSSKQHWNLDLPQGGDTGCSQRKEWRREEGRGRKGRKRDRQDRQLLWSTRGLRT